MLICKDCRCYHPVSGSDMYCGECCIGETRNKIAINEDITGCCLFEPKQPKKLTNADRIRQMTDDEELLSAIGTACFRCIYSDYECSTGQGEGCTVGNMEWLKQDGDSS